MIVKELIEQLKKADPRSLVVVAIDHEGNSFSKLTKDSLDLEGSWDEEEGASVHPDDVQPHHLACVVIWPG